MGCSVYSDKFQILLAGKNTPEATETKSPAYRSALQNPDISSVQLASLLRSRTAGAGRKKAGKSFWSNFMKNYVGTSANANTEKSA